MSSGDKGKRPVRCRYPKTTLKAANLVHVGTHVGILRDAIDDDVEYLLYNFRSVKYTPLLFSLKNSLLIP